MKNILNWCLAAITLTLAVNIFGQDDARLSATWQVQKYDIAATLPQSDADRNLAVKAKIDIKNVSSRPATTLTLRISPAAEVSTVSLNGANVDFTKSEEKVAGGSLQRLVVRVPSVQPGGSVSAVVDYKLNVKENSGLNALSPVGSQFLPLSYWYPTPNSWFFARGADYAPYRVQVNGGKMISAGTESGGAFEQKFAGQPFFLTGEREAVNSAGISVYLPVGAGAEERARAAELVAIATEAKTFAATLLGPAPEVPIRIVSVKRGGGFTSGGTILVDDSAFRRGKIDSQTAMTVADAIAKIWLGNAVVVTGDGNGAIREGLTKFIATQFLENKYGRDIADVERLRQRVAYASVSRRDSPLNVVSPLDDYYYPEVANKGAMVWRLLAKKLGTEAFFRSVRSASESGTLTLAGLRAAFPSEKEFLDHMFDEVTDTNLQAGLPQVSGGETKVALRNTGSVDATVNVSALSSNGEIIVAPTTVRAKSYGEVVFKTTAKVNRVEIDPEKFYPQTEYSDDVAPRDLTESDMYLAVKRSFDKQEFANAEKTARGILRDLPRFDDVRVLLARSLLALGRTADAEREFNAVLAEKLPTARSLAWANVGLADIALKNGQAANAVKFAEAAINADAEYGASLAARAVRNRSGAAGTADESVKAFFTQFDKAAVSNRKAEMDAMVLSGEIGKFAGGISGQTVEWKTNVLHTDKVDANTMLVETSVAIKLLNKEPESGTAVFRVTRAGNGWKLSGVDIFEVR